MKKKLEKVFEGVALRATKGKENRYDYEQATVSGFARGDSFNFQIEISSKRGMEKMQTTDFKEIMKEMKAFAPAKEWKLVKKEN